MQPDGESQGVEKAFPTVIKGGIKEKRIPAQTLFRGKTSGVLLLLVPQEREANPHQGQNQCQGHQHRG